MMQQEQGAYLAGLAGAAAVLLSGCNPLPAPDALTPPARYLGLQTSLLQGDLVQFHVQIEGGQGERDVTDYADCAAAQYALIRGFGFARHVRTNVATQNGIWTGDAVYTISAALPAGAKTLDAEVTVRDCGARGIPTV